jgi:hypothetical protein
MRKLCRYTLQPICITARRNVSFATIFVKQSDNFSSSFRSFIRPLSSSNKKTNSEIPLDTKFKDCFECSLTQNIHCLSKKCTLIQTIQTNLSQQCNLFEIFNVPVTYFIDEKKLDTEYKNLQKNFHPDKYINLQLNNNNSSSSSSTTSEGKEGLKDPAEAMKNITELSSAINYAYHVISFLFELIALSTSCLSPF